jgi:hypothetical protein
MFLLLERRVGAVLTIEQCGAELSMGDLFGTSTHKKQHRKEQMTLGKSQKRHQRSFPR